MENNFILKYFIQSSIVLIVMLLLPSIALSASGINSSLPGPNNLDQGLVGWWTFDGPDMIQNVKDKSGNGNHGAMSGFTSTSSAVVAGKVGQALKFDGGDDYVDAGNIDALESGDMSFSVWIKRDALTGLVWIMQQWDPSVGPAFYTSNSGALEFQIGSDDLLVNNVITAREWAHFVVTVQGTTYTMYKNSIQIGQATGKTRVESSPTGRFTIGGPNEGSVGYFNGSLDDVRIYNRALSQQEITELYNTTKGSKINTPSSFDNINNNLAAHWTFDGANLTQNVRDTSGNGKHGYLVYFGATSTAVKQGKVGQALAFDGNLTSISLPSNPITTVSNPSSSCAWAYNKDLTVSPAGWNQTFLNFYIDASNGIRMGSIVNDGKLFVSYRSGATAKGSQSSSAVFSNNTWVHICYVFDGNNVDLYKDGLSIATSTNTDSPGGASVLGARDDQGNGNWYGYLDDIRVYNRALSATEIKKVYDSSKSGKQNISLPGPNNLNQGLVGWWTFDGPDMISNVKDKSGNGNHGSMIGFTSTSTAVTAGKMGQALKFDGVNDRLNMGVVADIDAVSVMSVSQWVKVNKNTTYVFSGKFSSGSAGWDLQTETTTGAVRIVLYPTPNHATTPSNVIRPGVWHHVVMVYNGFGANNEEKIHIYIDGINQSLTYNGEIRTSLTSTAASLMFGGWSGGNSYFHGMMDDSRIYNRALSATEVQQLYNMGR